MGKYTDLKERVYIANMQVPAHKLAIFTWGNVSAIDRAAGVMAIKPSGVAYDKLTPADMVVVDLEGKVVDGTLRPSSDTNTHLVLYKAFESVGGIIHTHSTYATAWSQACRSIPIYGTTQADHLAVDIPCTAIMGDDQIKTTMKRKRGTRLWKPLPICPLKRWRWSWWPVTVPLPGAKMRAKPSIMEWFLRRLPKWRPSLRESIPR
jgi:L-ribulose-5-phosphate 4-epimerase